MGVYNGNNKLVVIIGHKIFHFYLPKGIDMNLKHETDSIRKHNELLAEHAIKNENRQLLSNSSNEHRKQ